MAKTKITEVAKTLKAWVAAALAALTTIGSVVVPDSAPGHLIAAAVAFLVTLLAVFGAPNAPADAVVNRDF